MSSMIDTLKRRITAKNWHDLKVEADGNQGKKRVFDSMLAVLRETERVFEEDPTKKMFFFFFFENSDSWMENFYTKCDCID